MRLVLLTHLALVLTVSIGGCGSFRAGDARLFDAGPALFRLGYGFRYTAVLPQIAVDTAQSYTFTLKDLPPGDWTFGLASKIYPSEERTLQLAMRLVDRDGNVLADGPCAFICHEKSNARYPRWSYSEGGYVMNAPDPWHGERIEFQFNYRRYEAHRMPISRDQFPITLIIEVCEPASSRDAVMVPNFESLF